MARQTGGDGVYERALRLNDGQFEITFPAAYANADGLENGDTVAFVPQLDGQTIVLDVQRTDAEGRHVRRIRRAGRDDQVYLRFPMEMAVDFGWDDWLAADEEPVSVRIERVSDGHYHLLTWPTTTPWVTPGSDDLVATSVHKRPIEVQSGPGMGFERYHLELPASYVEAYGLQPGDHLAMRLTARHGALALALSFDVDDENAENVRTVFRTGATPNDSGGYDREQFGIVLSKTYVDALGYLDSGVDVLPEQGQLILQDPVVNATRGDHSEDGGE